MKLAEIASRTWGGGTGMGFAGHKNNTLGENHEVLIRNVLLLNPRGRDETQQSIPNQVHAGLFGCVWQQPHHHQNGLRSLECDRPASGQNMRSETYIYLS
jgi:hypothetical protein